MIGFPDTQQVTEINKRADDQEVEKRAFMQREARYEPIDKKEYELMPSTKGSLMVNSGSESLEWSVRDWEVKQHFWEEHA